MSRVAGVRGAIKVDAAIAVIFSIGGAYYALKAGEDFGTVVAQKAEEIAFAVGESAVVSAILLKFPALNPYVLAASVVGIVSDTPLRPQDPADAVEAKADSYVSDLFPGYKTLPTPDQDRLKGYVIERSTFRST